MAIGAGGFREQYDNRTRILDWYAQRGLRPSTPIKPIDMEDDEDGQIRTWLDTHQIPIEGN